MNSDNDLLHQPDTSQQQLPRSFKLTDHLILVTTILISALVAAGYLLGIRTGQMTPQSTQRVSFQTSPAITIQPSQDQQIGWVSPILSYNLTPTPQPSTKIPYELSLRPQIENGTVTATLRTGSIYGGCPGSGPCPQISLNGYQLVAYTENQSIAAQTQLLSAGSYSLTLPSGTYRIDLRNSQGNGISYAITGVPKQVSVQAEETIHLDISVTAAP